MRLFRWTGLMGVVLAVFLSMTPSAVAGRYRVYTYGVAPVGAFGVQTFGVSPFAASGIQTFGVSPFAASGIQTFGVSPFAASGIQTFGVSPFAASGIQTFGVSPFAASGATTFGAFPSSFGTIQTFGAAPTTVATHRYRASTYFVTPSTILVPVAPTAPGTNQTPHTGNEGNVTNEVKQIKERLKSIEDDIAAIKKRLDKIDPPKPVEDPSFTSKKVEEELKALHAKYAQYEKDLAAYNKNRAELEKKMEDATNILTSATTTPDDKKKALAELMSLRKQYDKLTPPDHPTKTK